MRLDKYILLALLFIASLSVELSAQSNRGTSPQQTSASASFIQHTVKTGDTAYSIAITYKISVDDIFKYNPGTDQGINVGQILQIPQAVITRSNIPNARESKPATATPSTSSNGIVHTIKAKETLFSVSRMYDIAIIDLLRANPDLSENSFNIGREIIIPTSRSAAQDTRVNTTSSTNNSSTKYYEHRVEKKETLYSISRKYNCPIEDIINANPSLRDFKLREGSIIIIPQKNVIDNRLQTDNSYPPSRYLPADGVSRIALLMPFIQGSKSVTQAKVTEYYEGFLLAVQKMKERGLDAEVYTFDIGSDNDVKRLESILGTYEMSNLDLIIGGVSSKQIQVISRFAQQTGTNYVVPFSNKDTGVEHNKQVFQVANSHSNLYNEVTDSFVDKFRNCNIIFISENGSDKNKMDFVKVLQQRLNREGVNYRTAPSTASITDDLRAVLIEGRKNIIIPTSSSEKSLSKIVEGLNAIEENRPEVSLFGYPDWQIYTGAQGMLHAFDSYFYSTFYLDIRQPEVMQFAENYQKWYNKHLVNSYPRYAHMGYDTGIIFLTALQRSGRNFNSRIKNLNTPTLQSAFDFEPISNQGGYINKGIYIVNLKPDGSVVKQK